MQSRYVVAPDESEDEDDDQQYPQGLPYDIETPNLGLDSEGGLHKESSIFTEGAGIRTR